MQAIYGDRQTTIAASLLPEMYKTETQQEVYYAFTRSVSSHSIYRNTIIKS